jgi:cob(I)alamin adenosyltransferase
MQGIKLINKETKIMVQLTRIYTRSGDKGKTSLGDATRVLKSDARIEAIGDVDECNSTLGLIDCSHDPDMTQLIRQLQNDLFDVGADLCIPDLENNKSKLTITATQVIYLEKTIDRYNAKLQPLKSFVLPGGSSLAASFHFARTVARRAERRVCHLQQRSNVNPEIIKYLNRLSDLLFVLARISNTNGRGDILWVPGGKK